MEKSILDIGCGTDKVQGAVGIDRVKLPGVDVVHDLNKFPYPFKNETFDEVYLLDVIEHLDNVVGVIEECYRLLKPGGKLHIRVVYWNHKYAWSDPTHNRGFSEISFEFFTGKRRSYYTKAHFKDMSISYIYDQRALKIFKSKRLVKLLSKFLCNTIQGMNVILIK